MASYGSPDCPCINVTDIITTEDFECEVGTRQGRVPCNERQKTPCVPIDFGSTFCHDHHNTWDLACSGVPPIPSYCYKAWCYVDIDKCWKSKERIYKSSFFPDSDLYYSYTTCGSRISAVKQTQQHLKRFMTAGVIGETAIENKSGKRMQDFLVKYVQEVFQVTDELETVTFVNVSKSSLSTSSNEKSAVIRDVSLGITDFAVGQFWITKDNLQLASFTSPIFVDKIRLVLPKQEDRKQRVTTPLTNELLLMMIGTVILVSLAQMVMTNKRGGKGNRRTYLAYQKTKMSSSIALKISIFVKELFESFFELWIIFMGLAVEKDSKWRKCRKLLYAGFSFFILIFVSAYLANLAALLSTKRGTGVESMEGAIASNAIICATENLVLLEKIHPKAQFKFVPDYKAGEVELDKGRCVAFAISYLEHCMIDNPPNFSDIVVHTIPIAFPITETFAAGFTHAMYMASEQGVHFGTMLRNSIKALSNEEGELEIENNSENEFPVLSWIDLWPPLALVCVCALIASGMKLYRTPNESAKDEEEESPSELTFDTSTTARESNLVLVPVIVEEYFDSDMEDILRNSIVTAINERGM